MKALVLNLASETQRMAFQAAQLARLGIAHARVEASTPQTAFPELRDPYWCRWERPLRDTEKAALTTHRRAWEMVAAGHEPVLVLEDDALLAAGTADFLDAVEDLEGIDHISLEVRGRKKLVARTPHAAAPMVRLWQDRSGAAAYILWPTGARKLLARVDRRSGLADAVICAGYDLSSWQADPALAIQLDMCCAYRSPAPIAVVSAIDMAGKPDPRAFPVHRRLDFRSRRLAAQTRMGLRRLMHPLAVRRHIAFAGRDAAADDGKQAP